MPLAILAEAFCGLPFSLRANFEIVSRVGHGRILDNPFKLIINECQLLAHWFAEPISLTLKMEAICSSETSVETQQTTQRHIPEDDTLHNHRCVNLKSYLLKFYILDNFSVE
jgi:hypothetical protein